MNQYDGIDAFYSDPTPPERALLAPDGKPFASLGEARKLSPECDYGCQWRLHGTRWPVWRVSYIGITGEVYATCLAPGNSRTVVFGAVEPAADAWKSIAERSGPRYMDNLDRLLGEDSADPWWDHDDLAWVRTRVERAT